MARLPACQPPGIRSCDQNFPKDGDDNVAERPGSMGRLSCAGFRVTKIRKYVQVSVEDGGWGSRKRAFSSGRWLIICLLTIHSLASLFFAYCCCNNTIFSVPTWMPSFFRYPSLLLRFYVLIRFRLLLPGFYWFIQFCISFHGQEWVRLSLPLELNFVCKNISGRERKKSRANQIFLLGIRLHLCEA